MALGTTKSYIDNEEHEEDLIQSPTKIRIQRRRNRRCWEKGNQSETDDDITKYPSVTAASNPKSRNIEIERKELNVVEIET